MITKELLNIELKRLETLEAELQRNIKAAPKGTIYFRKGKDFRLNPYLNCSLSGKRKRKVLKNTDAARIKQLKFKTYSLHLIVPVRNNIEILAKVKDYKDIVPAEITSKLGPCFEECEQAIFGTKKGIIENAAFESLKERQNPFHPEELRIHTDLGDFRSKSESIIAMVLSMLGLHFKYEAPLWLGSGYIYPDFSILHPASGLVYYLEHFGLQEQREYRDKMLKKIAIYSEAGIFLGSRLLVTCESSNEGVNITLIRKLLNSYFFE